MARKQYSEIEVFGKKGLAGGRKDFARGANRKYESQFGRKELTSALHVLFSKFYHPFIFHLVGYCVSIVPHLLWNWRNRSEVSSLRFLQLDVQLW